MSKTKRVYGITDFGDAAQISSVEHKMGNLESGHVRVDLCATSVNPIDIKTRMGLGFVASQKPDEQFMGLGYDLYGQVCEVAADVPHIKLGDWVIGMVGFALNPGCYAQQVDVSHKEIIVLDKKENPEIAGLCLSGLTALQALKLLPILPQQPLYINAATGGVGHLALQLALMQGRQVVAVTHRAQHTMFQSVGVKTLDYDAFYSEARVGQLLDLVGGENAINLLANLEPGSAVVTVPTITQEQVCDFAKSRSIDCQKMVVHASGADLTQLYHAYRSGKLTIHVSEKFMLNDICAAHRFMENGEHSGKVIILT